MKKKNTHGGARKGAGRPVGTGTGRKAITKSVTMLKPAWDRLDEQRKLESRGEYIARKLSL
jgi:hypothetical protein